MKYLMTALICLICLNVSSLAGGGIATDPYGTIVLKDGSMLAIYRHSRNANVSYVAKFNKQGVFTGGCQQESVAAYQLRKARMKAASKWRLGYVPRKYPCSF